MPRDPRPWPRPCAQVLSFEAALGDLDRPFPWDEIEWNRCALQLSTQTGLDEIHNLFSFMSMGQVWIITLPYLTLPYLTLPCLTLPYLTLPYLTLDSSEVAITTLPYLTLPYLTLPYRTLPYLTLLP